MDEGGAVRIGTSGWRYAPWRGVFYPQGLPQRCELQYAARIFSSIEINGSFYSLQHPDSYAAWYQDAPQGFEFAVKGGRFITHMKRLRDIERPLANFFASGLFELKDKLGPILWQLPPNMAFEPQRLEAFLALLPFDSDAAQALARRRDARVRGRARLRFRAPARRLRHALEVRHESFADARFIDLLRRFNVALVVSDTPRRWLRLEDVTAEFLYLRLHGAKRLYGSGYAPATLKGWAQRIGAWRCGREPARAKRASPRLPAARVARDVYCYFDNTDLKLRAPQDARTLARYLGER
jgi:uncharacterized protein YecE (DUF72 family)